MQYILRDGHALITSYQPLNTNFRWCYVIMWHFQIKLSAPNPNISYKNRRKNFNLPNTVVGSYPRFSTAITWNTSCLHSTHKRSFDPTLDFCHYHVKYMIPYLPKTFLRSKNIFLQWSYELKTIKIITRTFPYILTNNLIVLIDQSNDKLRPIMLDVN
jgi:hypothetical protein